MHREIKKDFGLRDRLIKSAISIASNTPEGKEGETFADFIRFLFIAKGLSEELIIKLIIGDDISYRII